MLTEVQERVVQIIAQVLRLTPSDVESLRQLDGYKKVSLWTSAKHVEIIVAIEEEFDVEVDDASILKLRDVASIAEYLDSHA